MRGEPFDGRLAFFVFVCNRNSGAVSGGLLPLGPTTGSYKNELT